MVQFFRITTSTICEDEESLAVAETAKNTLPVKASNSKDTLETATTSTDDQEAASSSDRNHRVALESKTSVAAPANDRVRSNRISMTLLHYFVTYPRWSLSLFLFLGSRSISMPPARKMLFGPIEDLHLIVRQESNNYHHCTVDAFDKLDGQLNRTVRKEYNRVLAASQYNTKLVERVKNISRQCNKANQKSQDALKQWSSNGMTVPTTTDINETTSISCSEMSINSLDGDIYAAENQISSILDQYMDENKNGLERIQDYTQSRIEYDYQYFVNDRIKRALDYIDDMASSVINNNLHFDFTQELSDMTELVINLRSRLQYLLQHLEETKFRMEIMTNQLQSFKSSIEQFRIFYTDIRERLEKGGEYMKDLLPTGSNIPAFFDLSMLPLADSLMPDLFEITGFPSDFPSFEDILNDLSTLEKIQNDFIIKVQKEVQEILHTQTNDIAEHLREILTLDDYNPPTFNTPFLGLSTISDEVERILEIGERAKIETIQVLNGTQNFHSSSHGSENTRKPPIFELSRISSMIAGNSTQFSYKEFNFFSFTVPQFLKSFLVRLLTDFWIFELIFQTIRFWRLKKRYERDATPNLPEIDYGTGDDEEQQASTIQFIKNCFSRHFHIQWVVMLLIVLLLWIPVMLIWSPHVNDNCIQSNRGTFLANNMITPLLINAANVPGNQYHTIGESVCNKKKGAVCNAMFSQSELNHHKNYNAFQIYMEDYHQSEEFSHLLFTCVDAESLGEQFQDACCGLEGYSTTNCSLPLEERKASCPIEEINLNNDLQESTARKAYRPIQEYRSDCPEDLKSLALEDAIFDCAELHDTCDIQSACSVGVDERLIQPLVAEADCYVERYLIQLCYFVLLSMYHAIMLNIFCTLIINGVRHLSWRKLCPNGIKLKTQLNEQGDIVKGANQQDRTERIMAAVKRFELVGWVQLGLGTATAIFWAISFVVMIDKKIF